MKFTKVVLLSIVFVLSYHADAQAFLVVETSGKVETRKYPIGTDIRIHLKEDKHYLWHDFTIQDLDLEAKCIRVSDNYCIPLAAINGFDYTPEKGNALAKSLAKFAIPYAAYMGVQAIRGPRINNFQKGIGIAAVVGWFTAKLFFTGQVKINTRRRLRLIDLTMTMPKA